LFVRTLIELARWASGSAMRRRRGCSRQRALATQGYFFGAPQLAEEPTAANQPAV
jgi:hypothetical protein